MKKLLLLLCAISLSAFNAGRAMAEDIVSTYLTYNAFTTLGTTTKSNSITVDEATENVLVSFTVGDSYQLNGWDFSTALDLSAYDYMVITYATALPDGLQVRLYDNKTAVYLNADGNAQTNAYFQNGDAGATTATINLNTMTVTKDGDAWTLNDGASAETCVDKSCITGLKFFNWNSGYTFSIASIELKTNAEVLAEKLALANSQSTNSSNTTSDMTIGEDNTLTVSYNDNYTQWGWDFGSSLDFSSSKYVVAKIANGGETTNTVTQDEFHIEGDGKTFAVNFDANGIAVIDLNALDSQNQNGMMSNTSITKMYYWSLLGGTKKISAPQLFNTIEDVQTYLGSDYAPSTVTMSVGSNGYATFTPRYDISIEDNASIKAYRATLSGTTLTLSKTNEVKAGEGVVLVKNSTDETAYYDATITDLDDAKSSVLTPTLYLITLATNPSDGVTNYVLSSKNSTVGFYKANSTSLAAGKAYLQIEGTETSSVRIMFEDEEATGITSVATGSSQSDAIYSLSGARLATPQKGINIVGGKKVVIK